MDNEPRSPGAVTASGDHGGLLWGMRRIRYKSLLIAVLTVVITSAATPCPAAAQPARPARSALLAQPTPSTQPGDPARPPRDQRLRAALFTPKDLARGYVRVVNPSPTFTRIGSDNNLCDDLTSAADATDAPSAQAVFVRNGAGPTVVERLVAGGARATLATVWSVATAPGRCPALHQGRPGAADEVYLTFAPLRMADLGDASAALRFRLRVRAMNLDVRGVLVAVAHHGVAMTLVFIGGTAADRRAVPRLTRRAFHKLEATKVRAAPAP